MPLMIYSVIYFALVIPVSLYPGKLLDTVGNFLAPLKIIALIILSVAAIIWPAGSISNALEAYRTAPFSNGFVNGYLTMDTLGAMVFGIVIVNAARSRRNGSAPADPLHRLGRTDGRRGADAAVSGAVPPRV